MNNPDMISHENQALTPIKLPSVSNKRYFSNSQLSTTSDSSSPTSNSHAYDRDSDVSFPVLVQDKLTKIKLKARKSAIFTDESNFEIPVLEEPEEGEEKHFLKKLPVISDGEEFSIKHPNINNKIRGRGNNLSSTRCRSLDTKNLPLGRVQEARIEEDLQKANRKRKGWSVLRDLNEFNRSEKQGLPPRKFKLPVEENIIIEEKEKKKFHILSHLLTGFSSASSSHHGSHHNSPRFKLKVDELDKKINSDSENESSEIEAISEEDIPEREENPEYMAAKQKMHEEQEFIKKVLKSEIIDEIDYKRSTYNPDKEVTQLVNDPIQEENEDEKPEKTN